MPAATGIRWVAIACLACVGLLVSMYLTLYQLGVVSWIWQPFSEGDSQWILRASPLVRHLGFPDAALGVASYAVETCLAGAIAAGREGRWQRRMLGVIVAAMTLASLFLVGLQALYGRWCAACLLSAIASFAIAALTIPELTAASTVRDARGDVAEAVANVSSRT